MKDLAGFARQCQAELASIGISCGRVARWSVNSRANGRWGLCKKTGENSYEIQISHKLLEDTVSDQVLKDTIVHELLHTLPGCLNHSQAWKEFARRVNQALPSYQIKVRTSYAEKGIAPPRKVPQYRYILRCQKCGAEIRRQRMSDVVRFPQRYRCACGGTLLFQSSPVLTNK